MITVVDLFCGCGGMSLGFQNAGYTILAGFENWDSAVACYNANLNNKAIRMDLLNVDAVVPEITKFTPNVIIDAVLYSKKLFQFVHGGNFRVHHTVRITIERDGCVFMPHQFRKGFDIHSAFQCAGCKCVSQSVKVQFPHSRLFGQAFKQILIRADRHSLGFFVFYHKLAPRASSIDA